MHVRFSVQLSMTVQDIGKLIYSIGNPNVVFDDFYFYAHVDTDQTDRLQRLEESGLITSLELSDRGVSPKINGSYSHD